MLALTSISPSHINGDIQQKAVNTWVNLGFRVVSLNGHHEIEGLRKQYTGVEFVPTHRTMNGILRKPLVSVNALLDYAKDQKEEIICIINSDILLVDKYDVIGKYRDKMEKGIVMCKRMDFAEDININKQFESGIDVFFFNRKFLDTFHQSIYCLGATHWDWWIPFTAQKKGVPVYLVREPIAYHKLHNNQWDVKEWEMLSDYFAWENKLRKKSLGHLNTHIFNEIHNHLS